MSSPLTLVVLGQAYFLGPLSGVQSNSTTPIASITPEITKRNDYTYTPGIGAHKLHTVAADWNSARKICMREGGHLAIVNSRAESKLLAELIVNSGTHVGSADSNYVHIGFHDLYEEDEFVTVKGDPIETTGFNDWLFGGPNNDNNEDCGSIWKNGQLNDIGCWKAVGFICELPQD